MIYRPENVPTIQSSTNLKIPGKFRFDLWSCVISIKHPAKLENTALIIGYIEQGVGHYLYVVIPNANIGSDKIEIRVVEQELLESGFTGVDRPHSGILRTPQVGDKVMCVAKGRYAGAPSGEVHRVLGMPLGRVNIYKDSPTTYEDTYFVICESAFINSCGGIKLPIEKDKINKRVVVEVDKLLVRKKLVEPEIKKREIFNPEKIQRIK